MVRKLGLCVVASLLLGIVLPAHADTVVASGAGALPATAQDLTTVNVSEITGTIDDQLGVEMFKLNISDYLDFSAITVNAGPFGIPDTELFLFDSSGVGVYANDDIDGGNTLSCLPSAGAGNPCSSAQPAGVGPTANGTYYLAITRSANGPLDGFANEIFNIFSSTDVVGPSSLSPIADWDNGVFTSPDFDLTAYDIQVTGVSAPEPGVLSLLAIGLLCGLSCVALRKRQLTNCDYSQS